MYGDKKNLTYGPHNKDNMFSLHLITQPLLLLSCVRRHLLRLQSAVGCGEEKQSSKRTGTGVSNATSTLIHTCKITLESKYVEHRT